MLICHETICTRTIGNKRFLDEPETQLDDLASYLSFDCVAKKLPFSGYVDERGGGNVPNVT